MSSVQKAEKLATYSVLLFFFNFKVKTQYVLPECE
jgi:hypothetical protein